MLTLKQLKAKKKLTFEQLSEMTGVHTVNLNRIEKGQAIPILSTREKIEKALGQQINWLDSQKVPEQAVLSNWLECEQIFRKLMECVNGLTQPGERQEFMDTAGRYLRRMKKHNQ